MPRPYGSKFLIALNKSKEDRLGIKLARLCVEANLPATLVAKALNTSSTTVYSWFRGQGIREHSRKTVEVFINMVAQDLANQRLPASSYDDAVDYIDEMFEEVA
jgi:DNA invertase Pin-like site-specific DNA recombinase